MRKLFIILSLVIGLGSPAWGATRYVSQSGSDANSCVESEDISTPKLTLVSAVACLDAGDTLYIRGGTWNERIDLQAPDKTGTAGNYITIAGYPGDTVILQYTDTTAYGAVKARGTRGYLRFENFTIDAVNQVDNSGWSIRDGNHHFELRNIEIKNQSVSVYISANDVTFENVYIHDSPSTCAPGDRSYGIYIHDGARISIKNSHLYNQPGGGIQAYPGPLTDVTITGNQIHDNGWCTTTPTGGMVIGHDSTGGNFSNIVVSDNTIYRNGYVSGTPGIGGNGGGIRTLASGSFTFTGLKINNNSIYDNQANTGSAYGINIAAANINGEAINNLVIGNETGQILNSSTGTFTTSTNITTGVIGDYWVDAANGDFRLIQGTNTARDGGTTVTTRPSPVSTPDVGAYEQGIIASATVADGFIEVTVNVMTPGILPSSGITAFTISNGTSTGTPIVSDAYPKPGSSNVVLLSTTGFSTSGTCTISYGAGNLTDSGFVGPSTTGLAQGVNSVSGLSVSGTCDNSAGGAPPAGGILLHYPLDEGSGTTANDAISTNDGTVTGSPTWLSPKGISFTSLSNQAVQIPYGSGNDPTATSFTMCATIKADAGISSKIIMGATGLGTNQRFYVGTSSGNTWQLGIQAGGFSSRGNSEFPVTNNKTRICIGADSANNRVALVVGGVIGTSSASLVDVTTFSLAGNLVINCGVTSTDYCGGFTVEEVKVWTSFLSQSEFTEDYNTYTPSGGSVACYKQQDFKAQRVYLDESSDPINYLTAGVSSIPVMAGGAVAIVVQVDCKGSAGAPVAFQWLYSKNGGGYNLRVPTTMGADGISMWGPFNNPTLNNGSVDSCVSGVLSPTLGPTQLIAGASPTISLSQDTRYCIRGIFRVNTNQAGNYFTIQLWQDNGAALADGYTAIPRIDVLPTQANGSH